MAEENQPAASAPSTNFPVFSIWPPNQRTRDAVIQRLLDTLSSSSVLSKRYGVMDSEEAASIARIIENQAFLAASDSHQPASGVDDPVGIGIETLQVYSKEISKLMLESVKSRASSSSEKPASPLSAAGAVPTVVPGEDVSQSSLAISEASEN